MIRIPLRQGSQVQGADPYRQSVATPLALTEGEGPGVRVPQPDHNAQTLGSITDDLARAAQALNQRADWYEATAHVGGDPSIRLDLARDDRASSRRLALIASKPDRFFRPAPQETKP